MATKNIYKLINIITDNFKFSFEIIVILESLKGLKIIAIIKYIFDKNKVMLSIAKSISFTFIIEYKGIFVNIEYNDIKINFVENKTTAKQLTLNIFFNKFDLKTRLNSKISVTKYIIINIPSCICIL